MMITLTDIKNHFKFLAKENDCFSGNIIVGKRYIAFEMSNKKSTSAYSFINAASMVFSYRVSGKVTLVASESISLIEECVGKKYADLFRINRYETDFNMYMPEINKELARFVHVHTINK